MEDTQQQGVLQKRYGAAQNTASSYSDASPSISEGILQKRYKNSDDNNPAVTRARNLIGNTDYNGWCEAFIEQTLGLPKLGATAAEAWNNQLDKASAGLEGAKAGDPIYFAPDASNEGDGHTAIYTGNGRMISATDNGVTEVPISDWQKQTGQRLLGHIKL